MPGGSPTDRDALLLKLSALLDGELPEAEQNQLFDAMSQDPALLAAFESLAATRVSFAPLSTADGDALTASVMAAVDPDDMPASVAGALALASAALDNEPFDVASPNTARNEARLQAAWARPGVADALVGFVAASELARVGGSAVADLPEVARALEPVAERIDASIAATERAGILFAAHADAALEPAESTELAALWARIDSVALTLPSSLSAVREALGVAADSPAFVRYARRAGEAAINAVEAASHQPAQTVAAPRETQTQASFFIRLWQSVSIARVPLALAGAAGALFFALRGPEPVEVAIAPTPDHNIAAQALYDAIAPSILAEAPRMGDLPLLADNDAQVEALDANGTTMVFSTQESNITVIWVSGDDGEEQGT